MNSKIHPKLTRVDKKNIRNLNKLTTKGIEGIEQIFLDETISDLEGVTADQRYKDLELHELFEKKIETEGVHFCSRCSIKKDIFLFGSLPSFTSPASGPKRDFLSL